MNYSIIKNLVLKNRHSKQPYYICNLGDKMFIGLDQKNNKIIAHGSKLDVLRIIKTGNDYANTSIPNNEVMLDIEVFSYLTSYDSIKILNEFLTFNDDFFKLQKYLFKS